MRPVRSDSSSTSSSVRAWPMKNLNSQGTPIFPLNYHFDYDDTEVSII